MPHVSKKNLQLKELERLQNELVRSFERACDNQNARQVFNEFFTRTERIMFAKRLAVIGMLSRGVSTYIISQVLLVSPSTVERMLENHNRKKYEKTIKNALGKKDIWEILVKILFVGGAIPPRVGGRRWHLIDKVIRRDNLKNL